MTTQVPHRNQLLLDVQAAISLGHWVVELTDCQNDPRRIKIHPTTCVGNERWGTWVQRFLRMLVTFTVSDRLKIWATHIGRCLVVMDIWSIHSHKDIRTTIALPTGISISYLHHYRYYMRQNLIYPVTCTLNTVVDVDNTTRQKSLVT